MRTKPQDRLASLQLINLGGPSASTMMLVSFVAAVSGVVLEQNVHLNVNWTSFLARHDMKWHWWRTESGQHACPGNWSSDHISVFEPDSDGHVGWCYRPSSWPIGAFLGNGLVGAIVTMPPPPAEESRMGTEYIDFSLGRSDAYDTRPFFLPDAASPSPFVNQQGNIE